MKTVFRFIMAGFLAIVLGTQSAAYAAELVYTDVPVGSEYYEAVHWATYEGIVNGTGNGQFRPDDNLSLGMLSIMLLRQYLPEHSHVDGDYWEITSVGQAEWFGIYKTEIPDDIRYGSKVTWDFTWEVVSMLSYQIDPYPMWYYTGAEPVLDFDADLAYFMKASGLSDADPKDVVTRGEFVQFLYDVEQHNFNEPAVDYFWGDVTVKLDDSPSLWKVRNMAMRDWTYIPDTYKESFVEDGWTLRLAEFMKTHYPDSMMACGMCDESKKQIVVSNSFNRYGYEVLTHEMGHYADAKGDCVLDNMYMFEKEQDAAAALVGRDYCKTNKAEMFAECFRYILMNRDDPVKYQQMQEQIPLSLAYIERAYLKDDTVFDLDAMNAVTSEFWSYISE